MASADVINLAATLSSSARSASSDPNGTQTVEPQPALSLPDTETSSFSLMTGIPRTVYDDMPSSFFFGPSGYENIMINAQGLKLRRYFWPAPNPKCVLCFIHGHGAHTFFELLKGTGAGKPLSYEGSWVQEMNAQGISVASIDNQGCGRSEGLHGLRFYIESFDHYVNDVLQLSETLPASISTIDDGAEALPVFISGISLGGCIAFTAARRKPELFSGAVLLAPMLSLKRVARQGLNPYLRPLSAILSILAPAAAVVASDKNVLYPEIQALWDADPLSMHCKTRVRNANEYLRATETAMSSLESVEFPFLVFHSENDTMCDCDGSKSLYLKAKSEDKTLRLVNHMWHVLPKEPHNERILNEMIEWMIKRVE
jgi:acylglycerol lipase